MAFGLKKKKAQDPEVPTVTEDAQAPAAAASQPSRKKRKPGELLSSVVNESAIGAAVDIMKRNEAFVLPNGTSWVGLLLSVEAIGGLSQKQKGDATKGSIIELIAADKIQVVATKAMIDEEFLGIVPTPETLGRMEEYRLLTEAPYYWAVFAVGEDGNTLVADAVQDATATFGEAVAISRGEKTLSGVLPQVWAWGGGVSEPVLSTEATANDFDRVLVGAAVGEAGASAPALDADPLAGAFGYTDEPNVDYAILAENPNLDLATGEITDEEPALEFDAAQFEAQFAGAPTIAADEDEDESDSFDQSWQNEDSDEGTDSGAGSTNAGAGEDDYFQYLVENRDRVVDEQEVRDTIARRFLSNDLDLVVDLAEFERVFGTEAEAISLEIAEDPSDWLGSQVAQLSRQANAELAQVHRGHAEELRQLFVETMALHVEHTMADVSTEAPGSQYAALMEGAKRDFEAHRANTPQEVAEQRREIRERFEAAADSRAEQAAKHARVVYEDKHRPKLERDLAEVGLDLDRRVQEQYAHDRQTVLEMRRKEANVRMDVGTNRTFEHLRGVQAEQREAERALLETWNGRLIQFIDENRKNDIARAMVLADELARTNRADTLKKEHTVQLRELRREHAAREERLQADLVRTRQEALAELESRKAEWSASLEVEQDRARAGSALTDQLRSQIQDLGAQYDGQYRARIATLEADKEASALALERAEGMQKRANQTMLLLVLVLTLAAAAVGVIAGWGWGHNQSVATVPAGFAVLGSLLH